MLSYLNTCVDRLTQIPYPIVPHTGDIYRQQYSKIKLAKKFLHRHLLLKIFGQLQREVKHIEKRMRVLWLYTGKSNFGDATMDMSGRALLRNIGIEIDLLTLPKLHTLFCEDDIFANVYSNLDQIKYPHYDIILLNEFNYPSIRLKIKNFEHIPFACLFQYFHGPDRNQTLFSFAAINDIFGIGLSDRELQQCAKPYLHCQRVTHESVQSKMPASSFITLAVGGIDPKRTYSKWLAVLTQIEQHACDTMPMVFMLLGSENGVEVAEIIKRHPFKRIRIISLVNQLTLLQARVVIDHSQLFVGCDGGLMHIAHSTDTPSVTLFSSDEPPSLRLTQRCHSMSIQSENTVNAIDTKKIIAAMIEQLSSFKNNKGTFCN